MERKLMGPWDRLLRGREEVLARVGSKGASIREWSPGVGRWSLADVVEHLVLVEGQMQDALAREPSPERPRVVAPGRVLRWAALRFVLKAGIRVRAPVASILPTRQLPWDALLARWEDQRRAWEEWMRASDPAIHPTPRFKHPIVSWLSVPQALTFAADHLEHHLHQIGRIELALRRQGRGGGP